MMKKILVSILMIAVITGGCLPGSAPSDSAPPNLQVDTQATIDSIVNTSAAQTLAAQPSPSPAPATLTASPTATVPPTHMTVTLSSTPEPNLTTTPATATSGAEDNSGITVTPLANTSEGITLTPTLGILKYGTLPPAVPSAGITLVNKSKAEAYISLQNYPPNKEAAILEYPVKKPVSIKAPLGYYLYVVWVGGRQIVGEFVLHKNDDIKITIYKDKVVIQ